MEDKQRELPADEPQEITCSGGLKVDFRVLFGGAPASEEDSNG